MIKEEKNEIIEHNEIYPGVLEDKSTAYHFKIRISPNLILVNKSNIATIPIL